METSIKYRSVALAGLAAVLSATMSMLLQVATREGNFTRYMVNFGYDLMAAILTGTYVILNKVGFGLPYWRLLLVNAIFVWLWQWSMLHALEVLPLSVVAGLNSSMNPIFGAIMSTLLLAERPTSWFGAVLVRNIVVIWLMLLPLAAKTGGTVDLHSSTFVGALFTVVIAFAVGTSMTLQRLLKGVSPLAITFWSLSVNAVLWLPPASSISVRWPLVWPVTRNDGKLVADSAWLWLGAAAVVGSLAGPTVSYALHEMSLPAFVLVFGPVMIGMNCIFDILLHNQISYLTLLGLAVVVLGLIADVILDKKVTIAENEDTNPLETQPLMQDEGEEYGSEAKSSV